jgi:response regulator of citrate/malate metabolism
MLTRMNELHATRQLLSQQLAEAIAEDPIGALPIIAGLQRETDEQVRAAVRQAAPSSSWREIADALGVSKQAAHQRFKVYAKGVTEEMKTEHRAMKQARRNGDAGQAAEARARRDGLADDLRTAAKALKDQK